MGLSQTLIPYLKAFAKAKDLTAELGFPNMGSQGLASQVVGGASPVLQAPAGSGDVVS